MKHALDDLLKIRDSRESAAGRHFAACRAALTAAEQDVQDKKDGLEEYRSWRCERENALYAGIASKCIKVRELDELKLKVMLLREKELALEVELTEAEKVCQAARDVLDQARTAYYESVREKQKIEEHRNVEMVAESKVAEQGEEREQEELQKTQTGNSQEEYYDECA